MSLQPQRNEPGAHVADEKSSPMTPPAEQTSARQPPRLIELLDVLTVIGLIVLTPVAWLLPQRAWPKLGRSVIAVVLRLCPWIAGDRITRFEHCLGPGLMQFPAREIFIRELSRYFEDILLLLKCYRPDGWEPAVELRGLEHVQAAVTGGKGAVLWFSHFHHTSLISKIAIYRAGFAMSHLSHPRHGFSRTRFGMKFLNPIRAHVEDRYLQERIFMGLDDAKAAVNTLRERLAAGAVISITARDIARNPVKVPLLGGSLSLAMGAPGFAHQAQTALLPIFGVQLQDGAYATIIEPPLVMDASQSRRAAGEAAVHQYARRLEAVVREYPDQWLGWADLDLGTDTSLQHAPP